MLDLTPILNNSKAAVHCSTKDHAAAFFNHMKERYPEKVANWRKGFECFFGDEQCYAPYFPDDRMMLQCSIGYYREQGYDIVEFTDLIVIDEFERSDVPISDLLGL